MRVAGFFVTIPVCVYLIYQSRTTYPVYIFNNGRTNDQNHSIYTRLNTKLIFMDKPSYLNSHWVFVFFAFFISCETTNEESMLNEAIGAFQVNQNDLLLDNIPFKGPIEKNQIESFSASSDFKIYAWYYIHHRDTFWIYSQVHKTEKMETTVHFSKNIGELVENRKKWE